MDRKKNDEEFLKKYNEYLKTPQWKIKRQEKAKSVNWICEICGNYTKKFEIHHKKYENLTCEKMEELMFLCVSCHNKVHKISKKDRINIQDNFNGEIIKQKRIRECKNCKYSTIITYKGRVNRKILYCNKLLTECAEVCKGHYFGEEKEVEHILLPDNNITKRKKQKQNKGRNIERW